MHLIVGLGNPGKQYERTRHNLGFMIMDYLADKEEWQKSKGAQALYLKKNMGNKKVELLKPQTLMNNSGFSVAYAVKKHDLKSSDVHVIHDDKDILFGEIKIQFGHSDAGHNGVKSIIQHLKTKEFARLRVGIKPQQTNKKETTNFVLGKFTTTEQKLLPKIIQRAGEAIEMIIREGANKAMTKYNQ